MFNHVCPTCGGSFASDRRDSRYCSVKCRGAGRSNRLHFTCESCREPFSTPASALKKSNVRFCSRRCYENCRSRPTEERFWEKVNRNGPNGCWIWTGATANGYGRLGEPPGKVLGAHRLSYELHIGPIPDGLQINHRCDVRACVNPSHLYAGTAEENTSDLRERGPAKLFEQGQKHHNAKLTEPDVQFIRASSEPYKRLAARFGVTPNHIYRIRSGQKWA